VLQAQQQAIVRHAAQLHRDRQRRQYARNRGVNPGIEHAEPQQHGQRDEHRAARHAGPVAGGHDAKDRCRGAQPGKLDRGGIEQRDDRHRAQIVDDGHGQQEQPQRRRRTLGEDGEDAQRKGDVGRGGNAPAGTQRGIAAGYRQEYQRGHGHAGNRREDRQPPPVRPRKLPVEHLALDFEADDEEEYDHQPVVDPHMQRIELRDRGPRQLVVKDVVIDRRQRGIGHGHRPQGRDHQQNAEAAVSAQHMAERRGNPVGEMAAASANFWHP